VNFRIVEIFAAPGAARSPQRSQDLLEPIPTAGPARRRRRDARRRGSRRRAGRDERLGRAIAADRRRLDGAGVAAIRVGARTVVCRARLRPLPSSGTFVQRRDARQDGGLWM